MIIAHVQTIVLVILFIGVGVLAPAHAEPPSFKSEWYDPARPEVRIGGFASVWGPENGKADVNPTVVLPKPNFSGISPLPDFAVPRIQVGGMLNVSGGTSFGYADFIWTLNVTKQWFWEPYVGVAVHNGQIDGPSPDRASLGCHTLIHAGINLGYRFNAHWSIMATFDHVSNAQSFSHCVTNQSLNLAGVRVGYAF